MQSTKHQNNRKVAHTHTHTHTHTPKPVREKEDVTVLWN